MLRAVNFSWEAHGKQRALFIGVCVGPLRRGGRQKWFAVFTCAPAWSITAQAGPLPDHRLTPSVATRADVAAICGTRWAQDHRHVSAGMRREVFTAYGLTGPRDPRCLPKGCELDHLISREIGGADDVRNLWPEPKAGPWNAHDKDRLENRLYHEVCEGRISLGLAQQGEAQDWTALHRRYFLDDNGGGGGR
jgi:hypothetical protein